MKKQKYIIIASGIVIILFAYFSMSFLSGFKKQPKKIQEKEVFRYVKTKPVKYESKEAIVISSGRVSSKSEVALSAEVSGKILPGNIPFKKGQQFRKGDLLLKIYDIEAGLSLKANKSSFLNILAGFLPDFKISVPENYEEWYKFFEKVDINKDLPDLPEIKSTKEKVFLSAKNILSTYYNIKSAESTFKKYSIYAPFDGAITNVNIEVGGFAGIGTRLGDIINTKELELDVPLKLEDVKWVKIGDKVKVENNQSTASWNGTVIRKSGDLNIQTQSVSVFIKILNNRQTPIYKGQYLKAYFNTLVINNVMEIPRNSVINTNEVFVVKNDMLVKKMINLIKINEKSVFINGLNENEMIVVEPLINANENTKVKILNNI